jgi:vacuolar-type H+-ATPase subunit I/STV1
MKTKKKLISKRDQLVQKIATLKRQLNKQKTEAKVHYKNHEDLKHKLSKNGTKLSDITKDYMRQESSDEQDVSDNKRRRKLNFDNLDMNSQQIISTPFTLIELEGSQEDYTGSDGNFDLTQDTVYSTITRTNSDVSVDFAVPSHK